MQKLMLKCLFFVVLCPSVMAIEHVSALSCQLEMRYLCDSNPDSNRCDIDWEEYMLENNPGSLDEVWIPAAELDSYSEKINEGQSFTTRNAIGTMKPVVIRTERALKNVKKFKVYGDLNDAFSNPGFIIEFKNHTYQGIPHDLEEGLWRIRLKYKSENESSIQVKESVYHCFVRQGYFI
jgi:hypothetical protein